MTTVSPRALLLLLLLLGATLGVLPNSIQEGPDTVDPLGRHVLSEGRPEGAVDPLEWNATDNAL